MKVILHDAVFQAVGQPLALADQGVPRPRPERLVNPVFGDHGIDVELDYVVYDDLTEFQTRIVLDRLRIVGETLSQSGGYDIVLSNLCFRLAEHYDAVLAATYDRNGNLIAQ